MERNFAKKVDEYLKDLEECWFFNVQGSATQRSGIPDRVGCYKGMFFALELKRPDGKGVASPQQKIELTKIENAKGYCAIVENMDEVEDFFDQITDHIYYLHAINTQKIYDFESYDDDDEYDDDDDWTFGTL